MFKVININLKNSYSSSERKFFNITVCSLFLGLIYPVLNNGNLLTNLISVGSTFTAFWAIIVFFLNRGISSLKTPVKFFLIILIYLLVIGIFGGSLYTDKSTIFLTITQDLRYVLLFLLGGIYATDERYMDLFHQALRIVAVVAIIMGVIAGIIIAQSGTTIARDIEDQTNYHYWWASTTCFSYWGITAFFKKSERKIGLVVLFTYFFIGILFLKRSCFLNSIIIVMLAIFLMAKQGRVSKSLKILASIGIILLVTTIVLPSLNKIIFSSLFSRFSDVSVDIENFDRLIEWKSYQDYSTLSQKILGMGIGNYPFYNRYGTINGESSLLNALHLGFANIIFKGGVIYALFYLSTYLKIFKNWFSSKRYSTRYLICFGVSVSALISLLYEGSWTYTILPFCISAPIFYVANYKGNQESN